MVCDDCERPVSLNYTTARLLCDAWSRHLFHFMTVCHSCVKFFNFLSSIIIRNSDSVSVPYPLPWGQSLNLKYTFQHFPIFYHNFLNIHLNNPFFLFSKMNFLLRKLFFHFPHKKYNFNIPCPKVKSTARLNILSPEAISFLVTMSNVTYREILYFGRSSSSLWAKKSRLHEDSLREMKNEETWLRWWGRRIHPWGNWQGKMMYRPTFCRKFRDDAQIWLSERGPHNQSSEFHVEIIKHKCLFCSLSDIHSFRKTCYIFMMPNWLKKILKEDNHIRLIDSLVLYVWIGIIVILCGD